MSVWDPEARMQPFGWLSTFGHGFDPNPDLGPLKSHPRWWGTGAEAALRDSIRRWQWAWWYSFNLWFVENVRGSHQTEAMEYAAAKAKELGLLDRVRYPVIGKPCLHCGELFREDGVAGSCLARYGDVDSIDYCNPCMLAVVGHDAGEDTATKEQALDWLRLVANTIGRIPSQAFPGIEEFRAAARDERRHIVALCQRRPQFKRVKQLFGTWLGALIAAGLLEDGTRRLMRGTQCLARDGHVCFSLGEKTVDDFLMEMGLAHEKEPHYPGTSLRADFRVGDVFLEFLGLKGDPDYDEKTARKKQLCKTAGIRLLLIESKDLANRAALGRKIAIALDP